MKSNLLYVALASMAVGFVGCTQDNEEAMLPQTPRYIEVSPRIQQMTRTGVVDGQEVFTQDDAFQLHVWQNNAAEVDDATHQESESKLLEDGKWQQTPALEWGQADANHYFLAVFPKRTITDFNADAYTVQTNTSSTSKTAAQLEAANDLMVAKVLTGIKPTVNPVSLPFEHMMAKLVINVDYANRWDHAKPTEDGAAVWAKKSATIDYLNNGATVVTPTEDPATGIPLAKAAQANTNYDVTYTTIMIPQSGVREVGIRVAADEILSFINDADIPLESGNITTLNLKVGEDLTVVELAQNGVTIQPWVVDKIEGEDFVIQEATKSSNFAGLFNNSGILITEDNFTLHSLTYEALVNVSQFGDNNTIMGLENVLMFRIGDAKGGVDKDALQIVGRPYKAADTEFKMQVPNNNVNRMKANTWYHVAFTYDDETGAARLYINGKVVAEDTWNTGNVYDFSGNNSNDHEPSGFHIAKNINFFWGVRPFSGMMKEVRVWSVARTQDQLKQNMLSVNPRSEGLELYYKLNGSDVNGEVIRDATGHHQGTINGTITSTAHEPINIVVENTENQ